MEPEPELSLGLHHKCHRKRQVMTVITQLGADLVKLKQTERKLKPTKTHKYRPEQSPGRSLVVHHKHIL